MLAKGLLLGRVSCSIVGDRLGREKGEGGNLVSQLVADYGSSFLLTIPRRIRQTIFPCHIFFFSTFYLTLGG